MHWENWPHVKPQAYGLVFCAKGPLKGQYCIYDDEAWVGDGVLLYPMGEALLGQGPYEYSRFHLRAPPNELLSQLYE